MPRGRGFGRGFVGFGRGVSWFGWGGGFGNPYPFCRWFPWLPRWWWAYPAYYGGFASMPYYSAYSPTPYMQSYPYSPYRPY